MLTRYRFVIAFILALIVAILGLTVRNPQLALLSVPPLFYCVTLLISATLLSTPQIRAQRRVDRTRIPEEETIDVSVAMSSEGKPYPIILAHDLAPTGTTSISGDTYYQGRLQSGPPQVRIHYTLKGIRGVYHFSPIQALLCSSFGLAVLETTIDAPIELRFLPSREKLDPIQIRPRRTRAFAGPVRSNLPGAGVDFYGCRTYNPGDDIRRINWRAYARTNELIICDFEQERITDVNLILDARVRAHAFVGSKHTFEFATQATASLAESFCNQGNAVGLLVYGDVLNWVFPGVGRSQTDRILDELSRAQLANKIAFEELRQIPARLFPPYSQLVLVSCHLDEADIETLALLKSKGYSILFVSINTLPLERADLPQTDQTELAARIAYLRRTLYLGSLARYGVQVVDWDPGRSLGEALERSRRMRGRRIA
ncbi:DUF58 domain-containing protein [Candidatus Bipolaricaulota bacterium]|nr:DUF58 domain-containing protein [Candidatus Bipolaricaulota bacterium]